MTLSPLSRWDISWEWGEVGKLSKNELVKIEVTAGPRKICVDLGKGRRDLTNPLIIHYHSGHTPEMKGGANKLGYLVKNW